MNFILPYWVGEKKKLNKPRGRGLLVPVTTALCTNSPSNLEQRRSTSDLVTASQNKIRPFTKQRDGEVANIERLR